MLITLNTKSAIPIYVQLRNQIVTGIGKGELKAGEGFMQGIFLEYGITQDDEADGVRNGGFGSTGR